MTLLIGSLYGSPIVTLSGEAGIAATDASGPYDVRTGIRVNDDGTIDKYEYDGASLTITQIDAATDWIIPNDRASTDYEFQLVDNASTPPNYLSDSTATWIAMGSGSQSANFLQWLRQDTSSGSTWDWQLHVRLNGGDEIDNAQYQGINTII